MSSTALKKGHCRCGGVQFEIDAEPVNMYLCHCFNCKHGTGSEYAANFWVPIESVKITSGQERIKILTGHEDENPDPKDANALSYYCGRCLNFLYVHVQGSEYMKHLAIVAIGSFEDHSFFRPQKEYFSKRRCEWQDEIKGAQQLKELMQ